LHHSAHPTGSFSQIDRDHRERLGTAGCGYHFVVGNGTQSPDGQVEVATRWSDQRAGQHCRDSRIADINDYGIGVCLIGDFDNTAPSERQIAATRALVAYLQDRYGIPNENVVTHDRAARTATTCPGRNFPGDAIAPRGSGFVMRSSSAR
jgi:N-acetyl-anhydromuramyl-L-alanine amidase AmpD